MTRQEAWRGGLLQALARPDCALFVDTQSYDIELTETVY